MIKLNTEIRNCYAHAREAFSDKRGLFTELSKVDYSLFCQDNVSVSKRGVLRGLHFQTVNPQGKYVTCLHGAVWDVCVDLRPSSPTYLEWRHMLLDDPGTSFYIPEGCAHGFLSLEEGSVVHYKCTNPYDKQSDSGIAYNDPTLNISWPELDIPYIISERDLGLPNFQPVGSGAV